MNRSSGVRCYYVYNTTKIRMSRRLSLLVEQGFGQMHTEEVRRTGRGSFRYGVVYEDPANQYMGNVWLCQTREAYVGNYNAFHVFEVLADNTPARISVLELGKDLYSSFLIRVCRTPSGRLWHVFGEPGYITGTTEHVYERELPNLHE